MFSFYKLNENSLSAFSTETAGGGDDDLSRSLQKLEEDGPTVVPGEGLFVQTEATKPNGATRRSVWKTWRHRPALDAQQKTGSELREKRLGPMWEKTEDSQRRRHPSAWSSDSSFGFDSSQVDDVFDKHDVTSANQPRVSFAEFVMSLFRAMNSHGVPRIVQKDASLARRLVWLVLFLAATAMLFYQSGLLISRFLDYEYQVDLEFTFNKELNFPSVTFCNLSPMKRSSLECSRFDPNRTDPCKSVSVASAEASSNKSIFQSKFYDFNQPHPTEEEYAELGYRLEDMLIQCMWKGKSTECSHRNFTVTQNAQYGNCFTFNADRNNPVQTSQPGASFGLTLELFLNPYEEVGQLSTSSGVRMSLHQIGVKAFPEEDGFSLAPGFNTNIGVRQLQINRLSEPYGNCTDVTSEWDSLYPGHDYSRTVCVKSCLANAMFARCGCVEWIFLVGKRLCLSKELNFTEGSCVEQIREEYRTNKLECSLCFNPCVDKYYQTSISVSAWPAVEYQNDFRDVLSMLNFSRHHAAPEWFRERYLRVEIYFEELNYENILQKPSYEITNLLADIGGQLGLWIGLSVLAFLEVIEYLFHILLVAVGKAKKPVAPLDET